MECIYKKKWSVEITTLWVNLNLISVWIGAELYSAFKIELRLEIVWWNWTARLELEEKKGKEKKEEWKKILRNV